MKWQPAAVLALGFIVISPAIWSGWIGDDALYSALRGMLGADRITLWQAMRHAFDLWFHVNGRVYPGLILEKYLVFYFFTNLIAYKLFLVASTLAAIELFRRCVQAYTTPAFGLVCALLAIVLLLERGGQDALLAYNAMPQLVAIAMLASLLFFRTARIASFGLYVAAALTYEDVYALCVLYPILAGVVCRSARSTLRASWPFLAAGFGLTAVSLIARAAAHVAPGSLYAFNFDVPAILRTALDQATAAFPLAYWWTEPVTHFSVANVTNLLRGAPLFPAVFLAFAFTCWAALNAPAAVAAPGWRAAAIGGLSVVLPALPIAFTVKYQTELHLGVGYLPVFFEQFGVALIFGAAVSVAVRSRLRTIWTPVIVCIVAGLGTITWAANVETVRTEQPSKMARAALESRVSAGLLSPVPDGSAVATAKIFDWIAYDNGGPDGISTRGLFYALGHRKIDLVPPADERARFLLRYDLRAAAWSIRQLRARAARSAAACNRSSIQNGDFTSGFRCWANVAVSAGRDAGYPRFRLAESGKCLPVSDAGNPFFSIDAPAGADGYLAQTFVYRARPTIVRFRAWGTINPIEVTVGIVYPVGIGIGSERILDSFVPPSIQSVTGACSGLGPVMKRYSFAGFTPGTVIQLRLHVTSAGANGAIANFDRVTSSP